MRPQTLTFCGLGTYTAKQTIDFTDKRFIAIVGDTGAGKSTILEAICYALYNRCTYAATASPLVADGGDGTLAVELTFTVGSRRWQVSRSVSRHTATSVHRLTCLDTGALTTGARQVTAEIRRIVGLDCDTFLRAVVLPQGRFQELLRMSDRDRGKVLDSVLGLEQLGQVREHARTLQARLKDRLNEYQLHRRRFLDDPAAALAAAAEQHSVQQQGLEHLQNARAAIADARAEQRRAAGAVSTLTQLKESLAAAVPAGAADQLHALASQAQTLNGQRADINQLTHQLQIEQDLLQGQLTQAEQYGGNVAGTATTISTLKYLAEQLPQQRKRHRQLTENAEALAVEQLRLQGVQQSLADLEPAVAAANKTHADAETAFKRAQDRQHKAVERLRIWRGATADLEKARAELATTEEALGTAIAKAREAAGIAEEAEHNRSESEQTHRALLKANAAAHAAADLEPGAACLICTRPLPADFTAPIAPDLTAADDAHKKARVRAEKTGRAAAVAAARVEALERDNLPAAQQSVTTAESLLSEALISLREVVGDADLSGTDEQILKLVTDDAAKAQQDVERAGKIRDDTRDTATAARTEFVTLSEAHAKRMSAHQEQERDNVALRQSIDEAASRLPARFTLATPLDVAEVQQQKAAAEAHQRLLQELAGRRTGAEQALAGLRSRSAALETTYAKKITKPAATLRDKLLTLAQRVNDAAGAFGLEEPAAAPTAHVDLDTQAHWAADLLAQAKELLGICAAKIDEQQRAEKAAGEAIGLACHTAGADGEEDLEQQYLAAHGTVQNLKRQIERAREELPVVNALQERIDAAAGTVEVLAQLSVVLAEGKFIAEAVSRRLQALLHQASEILLSISGGRYRFTADFRIIDMDTMAARDVKTLSGGETFLASLALALAVVELASRATGHVEALFLDEGFGTLDTTFLRDALNTLTDHSTTGRLVTVISHMRSITENAEHVLVVEKSLTTSHAHWADASERERIINDDLGRGLLE